MRGYKSRMHTTTYLTDEDKRLRRMYTQIQPFTTVVKSDKTLTFGQKEEICVLAKKDLDAAKRLYTDVIAGVRV